MHLELILDVLHRLLNELAENVDLGSKLINLGLGKTTLLEDALETGKLLGGITLVLAQLVEDAEVVVGVLELGRVL